MNTIARLDPRIKQQIKLSLVEAMYAPSERRFANKLRDIIIDNSTKAGYSHHSFSYKGQYYNLETIPLRYKNQHLLPELHARMDAYLADIKHLEYTEKPYVVGFFNKVLNASNSIEDYCRLLPECVHTAMAEYTAADWAAHHLPRELSDDQVEAFQLAHSDWILMLKKRKVLDLVTT